MLEYQEGESVQNRPANVAIENRVDERSLLQPRDRAVEFVDKLCTQS